MSLLEAKSVQTPEQIARVHEVSANKHFRMEVVPMFIAGGILIFDHFIPAGWPTLVEEEVLLGCAFEFTRRAYLSSREKRLAGEAKTPHVSAT